MKDIALTDPVLAPLVEYANSRPAGERVSVLHGAGEAVLDAVLPWDVRGPRLDEVLASEREHFRAGYLLGMAAVGEHQASQLRQARTLTALAHALRAAA